MNKISGSFPSVTGQALYCVSWVPDGKPLGVLQLVHGMAEHIERYDRPASAFANAGWLVVGHTHLGHGDQAELKGYFGKEDGWQHLLDDIHTLRQRTEQEWPGLPYVLLGHSMGSFLARCYLTAHGEGLAGCILSGTGFFPPPVVGAGLTLARLVCATGGARKPSPLINSIAFSANNKPFEPKRTGFEWLSRDEAEVAKYAADPNCGFLFTGRGYLDLFQGLRRLNDLDSLKRIPPQLPVLFCSGQRDPVGGMGAGVGTVAEQFKNAGLQHVQVKLYPECRHELFNELNREQVYSDVLAWLSQISAAQRERSDAT